METKLRAGGREIVIGYHLPTRLVGERINPSGRKRLAAVLRAGDLELIRDEAISQVESGADILDVNVAAPGVDEPVLLPEVVDLLQESVQVPLCIDINDPGALEPALKTYKGKAIVNSVTGEEKSLRSILPLVKQYGAAVIGLTMDETGIPKQAGERVKVAYKIVKQAENIGIPIEDVIIDCLALTVGADGHAALVALEAIRTVKRELGVNQTIGASNISFGLPDREIINQSFLPLAIEAGVTCPVVDAAKVRQVVLATDLLLGRDRFAQRYIHDYSLRTAH